MNRPKINIWMILYIGISLILSAFVAVWCFRDAFFTPPEILEPYANEPIRLRAWNFNLLIISAIFSLTYLAVLPMMIMKKRTAWIWYVVMGTLVVSIILSFWRGVPSLVGLAPTMVIAFFWYSKENRQWYRILYTKN